GVLPALPTVGRPERRTERSDMKLKVALIVVGVAVFGALAELALAGSISPITVAQKNTAATATITVIPGGDTAAAQTISVLSWSVGVPNPKGGNAASAQDFTLTKLIDKASPTLSLASAGGQTLPRVDIDLNRPGAPAGTPFMHYRLTNVLVTSDDQTGTGNDP